jgi:hypothetical protein
MLKRTVLAFAAAVAVPAAAFGQDVVVARYAVPVPGPVVVTSYAAPVVTAPPVVTTYSTRVVTTAPAAVVTTYRQPLLRPWATVVRTAPAAVVAPPVVSYAYTPAFIP